MLWKRLKRSWREISLAKAQRDKDRRLETGDRIRERRETGGRRQDAGKKGDRRRDTGRASRKGAKTRNNIEKKTYPCSVVGGEVAEDLFERGLCLPSGMAMTDGDLDRVIDTILNSRFR